MTKQSIPNIPTDTLVTIQVSGHFYRKLLSLSIMLAESKPHNEYIAALEKIKANNSELSFYEFNLHTILTLVHEIEASAKEQGKVQNVEIDLEGDKTSEN